MSAAFDRETELPRATAGDIAVNNLASARHHVWSRFLDVPERPGLAESIVELEGMTIEFLSDFGALDRLGMLADQLTLMEVDPARTAVIQAQVASASHRFDLARDHLSRARFLGAPDDAVTRVSLGIDQACGARLEQVLTIRRAIAAETGKLEDRVPLGALLADLREFDEADRVYRSALRDYRDVSPFALAWVCFQLGVLWGELASERQAARAAQWYRQAIAYLPAYVKARVHLAEIYLSDGRPSDAEALLIPARSSGDPEVFWRLGDVLTAMGRASEAEEHLREAREGFETLLDKHLLAFADHGVEFYSGSGRNASRAFELASVNVANRPTLKALQQAHAAAIDAGEQRAASDIIAAAGKHWGHSAAFRKSTFAVPDTDIGRGG
jgi:tetratricopeptide (TPR) repeat protein